MLSSNGEAVQRTKIWSAPLEEGGGECTHNIAELIETLFFVDIEPNTKQWQHVARYIVH